MEVAHIEFPHVLPLVGRGGGVEFYRPARFYLMFEFKRGWGDKVEIMHSCIQTLQRIEN